MKRFGFIGIGNIAQATIRGWIQSGQITAQQIAVSGRSDGKVKAAERKWGVKAFSTNEALVEHSDVVLFCTKPQDLQTAVEPISSSFHKHHIVISLAAGIPLHSLEKLIPSTKQIVRTIVNTPVQIQKAVIGYSLSKGALHLGTFIEGLFSPLGIVINVEEGEPLAALTVGTSSGIGFILEQMIYWQEWLEEHDFSPETARKMTIQTFEGAAQLARLSREKSLTELQNQVVSKKGVTSAGLNSIRKLEMSTALRMSFEKAVLRDREIGETFL